MPTGHSRSVVFVCRSVSLISTFVFRFLSQFLLQCSYYFVSVISIRVLLLMYIFPVFSQITLTIFIFQNENKVTLIQHNHCLIICFGFLFLLAIGIKSSTNNAVVI